MHEAFKVVFGYCRVNLPNPYLSSQLQGLKNWNFVGIVTIIGTIIQSKGCFFADVNNIFFLLTKIVQCFFLNDPKFFHNDILWFSLKYLVDTKLIMLNFCCLIGLHMWFFLSATKGNNAITPLHVQVSLSFLHSFQKDKN